MSKRAKRAVGSALVLAVAVVAGAWRANSALPAQPPANGPKPALVAVAEAQPGTLARTLELTGTVAGEAEIGLFAKVEQPIRWLQVQEGDRVTAGQVLVRLDDAEMQAQLTSARAEQQVASAALQDVLAGSRPEEIAQAEAGLRQAAAAAQRAVASERNAQAIYAGPVTGAPRQAIEEAEGKLDVATAQLAAAQAALDAARRNLAEVRQLAGLNTAQEQTVNEARGKVEVAAAQVEETRRKVAAAGSQVDEARSRVALASSQLDEAQEKVAVARTQIEAAEATAANAQAEHDRAQALLKIGGLSQEEADRAALRRRTASSQLESARRGAQLAEAQVRSGRNAVALAQAQQQSSEHARAAAEAQSTGATSALRTAQEGERLASRLLATQATPNQQVAEAEGRVAVAAAQLSAAEAAVTAATKALRQVEALQTGPLPQRELDEATGRVAETRAAAEAARERVALLRAGPTPTQLAVARARVEQAATRVGYWLTQVALCTLTAPISGVVTQRHKDVGDKTDPKQPILTIVQAGRQLVRTSVSDRELGGLRAGLAATVELDGLSGQVLDVTVTNVYPAADPITRLVPVELLLPPLPRAVADGSFARIRLQTDASHGLVIPQAALLPLADGKHAVFVVTPEQKAHLRPLTVALEADGQALVTAGLTPGTPVVVQGQDGLKEGQPIKVMPSAGKSATSAEPGGGGSEPAPADGAAGLAGNNR